MNGWVTFWGALLVCVLILFAGLAIVVGIAGASDVRALFRSIDAQHEAEERRKRNS